MGQSANRRAFLAAVVAAALACGPFPPSKVAAADEPARASRSLPPAKHGVSIEVLGSTYGMRRSTLVCSSLATAKRLCQGRDRCDILASDTVCDAGQRVPSVLIATLVVQYHCFPGDVDRSQSQDRPFMMSISCAALSH